MSPKAMRLPSASRSASRRNIFAFTGANLMVCQMGLFTMFENYPCATFVQFAQSVEAQSE